MERYRCPLCVRMAGRLLGVLLSCGAPALMAADFEADLQRLGDVSNDLTRLQTENMPFYLDGKPEQALAAMESAAKPNGWLGTMAIANMVWTMHPEASLAWHERAYQDSGKRSLALLELGLHYTRHDQCERALEVWKVQQEAGHYGGYFPALGAYCHLRLGHDTEAVAELRRAEFGSHGGMAFARILEELWGERPVLARYADAFAAYRQTRPGATLESVIKEAGVLPVSSGQRYDALLRVTAFAAPHEPTNSPELRELDCLRPLFEAELSDSRRADERGEVRLALMEKAEAAGDYDQITRLRDRGRTENALDPDVAMKRWNQALARCALMVDDHPLPVSSQLMRMLVVEQQTRGIVKPAEQLARYGTALWARAESDGGDPTALEVLASLQSAAEDKVGLRRSDELGWHRYHMQKFAASRVLGEFLSAGRGSAEALKLLDAALADFPDEPVLLELAIREKGLEGESRKALLRRILLVYHKIPTPQSELHFGPSSSHVIGAWLAYAEEMGTPLH